MPAERITTAGRDNWQARSGYRRMSDQNARLVRPKGEMSWLEGSLFVAAAFVLLAIGAAALPDKLPPPDVPGKPTGTHATEPGAEFPR